ncbi:MAG: single-stranded DNA-binding protein [Bacteroidales bacterium]|nr:single-stranded DNA-binding protein [Bacteroidales bacterium]
MSLNKVMLIGNVGKDPEVRHLESGATTASFTLATTERYKDKNGETKDQTEWHNIVCWRALADLVEKYVRKGSQLYIEGRIRTRSYTDRDGNTRYITEITADNLQMLGRKESGTGTSYPAPAPAPAPAPVHTSAPAAPKSTPIIDMNAVNEDEGDDLPF